MSFFLRAPCLQSIKLSTGIVGLEVKNDVLESFRVAPVVLLLRFAPRLLATLERERRPWYCVGHTLTQRHPPPPPHLTGHPQWPRGAEGLRGEGVERCQGAHP
jgi:hypothetical protein